MDDSHWHPRARQEAAAAAARTVALRVRLPGQVKFGRYAGRWLRDLPGPVLAEVLAEASELLRARPRCAGWRADLACTAEQALGEIERRRRNELRRA